MVGLLKFIGIIALIIDIPLAFNKKKEPRLSHINKDLSSFYKQGWRVLKAFTDENFKEYRSTLYINREESKLILALKGSASWRDWIYTNFPAIMDQQPKGQVKLMFKLLEKCILEAKRYNIHVLTITGHSLGGFLTQICVLLAAMHFEEENIHVRGVTYDSPGAKDMLEEINCNTENNQVDLKNLDIVNYVTSPNLINIMHEHTGSLYMTSTTPTIHQLQNYRFPILFLKLLFYIPLSFVVQLTLLFIDSALKHANLSRLNALTKTLLYYISPVPIILIALYLIYTFHYKWLVQLKNVFYSIDHHTLNNFIKAGNSIMGNIEAVEVSYFPKYGQLHQGPGEFFLDIFKDDNTYLKNIKEGPFGICYVKSNNSSNIRFLPLRHLLPEVHNFLQELNTKHSSQEAKDLIFKLLGIPIQCVYNRKGVLKGIYSLDKDIDIHILMDKLAFLLRKNNYKV